MRAAGRPQAFDAPRLLDDAVELVWREGPCTLSFNEIAASLGQTKPSIMRRFGAKDAFLSAVLNRYGERIGGGVVAALEGATTPAEVARAYLEHLLGVLAEKPVGPATGCLLAAATETSAAHPETPLAQTAQALNERARRVLRDALARVGADDPDALTEYLYGQSVALAFLSRTGADEPRLRAFAERALSAMDAD